MKRDELPIVTCATRGEWEQWLAQHQATAGAWLRLAKKGAPEPAVSRADALEVALCYGWIDGQAVSVDVHYWLQRFTPRRRRSKWSQLNREAAERLIAAGRMLPAGLAEVEAARRDGRWDAAYASPRNMTVPQDFQEQLDAHPAARAFFETLGGQKRYAFLYRIQDAKKPETRQRRIANFIELLSQQKTL